MTRERLYLFDTTRRDGQQTQGVQFSTSEKIRFADLQGRIKSTNYKDFIQQEIYKVYTQ